MELMMWWGGRGCGEAGLFDGQSLPTALLSSVTVTEDVGIYEIFY